MRVLLAEDNIIVAQAISLALKAANVIVDHSDLGEEAFEMVRHYDYDIVLVSMKLPDMDGLDLVRRMRSSRLNMPVLVLTDNENAQKRMMAFSIGADDVVARNVDHNELVARLHAIVRRTKGFSNPIISVGAVQINQNAREVTVNDVRVALTGKEYAILELLVIRKGQVLTKDVFLNHLYGGMDEPEMKIIDVFICKLRKKLLAVGVDNLIGTVWGRGYILHEKGGVLTSRCQSRRKEPGDELTPPPTVASHVTSGSYPLDA